MHLNFFTVGWVWAISCLTIRYGLTYHSKIFSNRLSLFLLTKWFYIILIAIILFHRFKISFYYTIYNIYRFKSCSSFFWLDEFVSAYKWSSHTYESWPNKLLFLRLMCHIKFKLYFSHMLKCLKESIIKDKIIVSYLRIDQINSYSTVVWVLKV